MGYGKTNELVNLISHQTDIDNIYLYATDPHGTKYQLLFDKRKDVGLKDYNHFKAFIEYSNYVDNKNIQE